MPMLFLFFTALELAGILYFHRSLIVAGSNGLLDLVGF